MVLGRRWGQDWGVARDVLSWVREANGVFPLPAWVSGSSFLSSDLRPRLGARRVGTDPNPPGGPCANSPSRGGSPRPRPLPPGRAPLPPNGSGEREVADSCGATPRWPRRPSSGGGVQASVWWRKVWPLSSNWIPILCSFPPPPLPRDARRAQGEPRGPGTQPFLLGLRAPGPPFRDPELTFRRT